MNREHQAASFGEIGQHALARLPRQFLIAAIFAVPVRVRDLDRLVHDIADETAPSSPRERTRTAILPGRVAGHRHQVDAFEQSFVAIDQPHDPAIENGLHAVDERQVGAFRLVPRRRASGSCASRSMRDMM